MFWLERRTLASFLSFLEAFPMPCGCAGGAGFDAVRSEPSPCRGRAAGRGRACHPGCQRRRDQVSGREKTCWKHRGCRCFLQRLGTALLPSTGPPPLCQLLCALVAGSKCPAAQSLLRSTPTACSALKAVLDRVTAAAQAKDAQVEAARAEAAAASAARDAVEATLAGWQERVAAADSLAAALATAQREAEVARHDLLQLQLAGAAEAQRWEQQLLSQRQAAEDARRAADEERRAAAAAEGQQQALQAEVAQLRQLVSAKDQQIGALSSAANSRPSSADSGRMSPREAQRVQEQVRRACGLGERGDVTLHLWSSAACDKVGTARHCSNLFSCCPFLA